ncbi:MAG: GHKL domain-containing protein, partial [Candidatus Krumholzibacteria bacterium]|nr:GHKL domain-containing protein [Candidatus Krumholzibacteria bacterium]
QNSFDGIIATNAAGVITIFNQVAERLTRAPRDEVIGIKHWQEFFEDGLENTMDLPLSHEPIRRLRGFAPKESAIRRVSGELIDVQLAGISLFDRGLHIGKVFFFQDLREIKTLRENLIQSKKLAAAGQAAAGISHSIKNILDGFNGGVYVYNLGKRRGDEDKMAVGWEMIERNVRIISDLVTDLLNFAKPRQPDLDLIDPRALIDDVIANTGVGRAERINIRVEQIGPERRVALDKHAFHQCLANLLCNAVEAYPEDRSGTIVMRIEIRDELAIFSVQDDGTGMNPQTITKVKNGMYSTKGSKGTGLGLQVVQKIVNEHKGILSIESVEGEGSTFRIEMPASDLGSPMRSSG